MNKIKLLSVSVVALLLPMAFMPSAQAADPVIMYLGDNYGRIDGARNWAYPRDGECDGWSVWIEMQGDDIFDEWKKVTDDNGCTTGGPKGTVPAWVEKARLCEERSGSTPDVCTSWRHVSAP